VVGVLTAVAGRTGPTECSDHFPEGRRWSAIEAGREVRLGCQVTKLTGAEATLTLIVIQVVLAARLGTPVDLLATQSSFVRLLAQQLAVDRLRIGRDRSD